MNSKLFTSVIACLLLVVVVAMPSNSAAADADNQMLTRVFKVPPNFLTGAGMPGKPTAVEVLKAQGIVFPEGASAVFNPTTSQLIAKNTQINLAAIDAFVNRLLNKSPANSAADAVVQAKLPKFGPLYATVSVQAYELSKKDPLVAQMQDSKADAKSSLEKLSTLAARGFAKVAGLPTISAKSGQRATTASGDISLEIDPVIGPDHVQVSLTGVFRQGAQSLPVQAVIPFGSTTFLGALETGKNKSLVELVFLRVSAQLAGAAPDSTPEPVSKSTTVPTKQMKSP